MWFPLCFWESKGDIFGSLNEREEDRGKAFLFYSAKTVSGGDVLMALVAGDHNRFSISSADIRG